MKRAVLYARVSTDAQHKDGTIESQVLELKRQIAAAGDVLVKEYVDDGYSGTAPGSAGARGAAEGRIDRSVRRAIGPEHRAGACAHCREDRGSRRGAAAAHRSVCCGADDR
jgi:hypothetical protein